MKPSRGSVRSVYMGTQWRHQNFFVGVLRGKIRLMRGQNFSLKKVPEMVEFCHFSSEGARGQSL